MIRAVIQYKEYGLPQTSSYDVIGWQEHTRKMFCDEILTVADGVVFRDMGDRSLYVKFIDIMKLTIGCKTLPTRFKPADIDDLIISACSYRRRQ